MENKYYKIAAIAVLAAFVLGTVLVLTPRRHGTDLEVTEFEIRKGQSLGETGRLLAERGLVFNRVLFVAYAIFAGKEKSFKAGTYEIPSPISIYELINLFSSGKSKSEDVTVVIPEGMNVADVGRILAKAGLIGGEEFLRPEILAQEGYLFPDTYRFEKSEIRNSKSETISNDQISKSETQVQEIVQKMRKNFGAKTEDLFKGLNVQKVKETIIIASMLEKEVRTEEDMRLVAGIIERRLAKNMPLEIDATVTYAVCRPEFLSGRYCDVSQANIVDNLKIDSPYNTYGNKGLPPGPISNPGLAAIKAALNPQPSDYFYYLSAKDGTTIFSRTAEEHLRARAKYLK